MPWFSVIHLFPTQETEDFDWISSFWSEQNSWREIDLWFLPVSIVSYHWTFSFCEEKEQVDFPLTSVYYCCSQMRIQKCACKNNRFKIFILCNLILLLRVIQWKGQWVWPQKLTKPLTVLPREITTHLSQPQFPSLKNEILHLFESKMPLILR